MSKYIIRTSDRGQFKRCRQLWDFGSKIRGNYEALVLPKPLEFGTAIHAGLEAFYDPKGWLFPWETRKAACLQRFREVCAEQKQKYLELKEQVDFDLHVEEDFDERFALGNGMLDYYCLWAEQVDKGWMPVKAEIEFEVPIPVPKDFTLQYPLRGFYFGSPDRHLYYKGDPVVYQGRLDMLVEDHTGDYWIWDHKTAAQAAETTWLALDEQCGSYVWAMAQLGVRTRGVVYNELFKRVPHPPQVLKSGALSVNKQADTTYELFIKALDEGGYRHGPYLDYLEHLKTNPKTFVRRTQVHRSQRELDQLGRRILMEAIEMLDEPLIYPNPHRFNCNGCQFFNPCIAVQEQTDVQFHLDNLYRKRKEPDVSESVH